MNDSFRSFLSQIFSSDENGILIFDSDDGNNLFANNYSLTILDYTSAEIINKPIQEIFPEFQNSNSENYYQSKAINKSKDILNIQTRIKKIIHPFKSGHLLIFVEIKKIETKDTLLDLRINSHDLLNRINIPILSLNGNLIIDFANESAMKTLGLIPEKLKDFDIINIISSDIHFREKILEQSLNKQIQLTDINGNNTYMLFQSSVLRDENKKFKGLLILLFDFSELKQAEQRLRNSEERIKTILATLNNGIVMVDENGIIQEIVPIFKFLLFQFIPLEKGDQIFSFLDEEIKLEFLKLLKEVFQSYGAKSKEFNFYLLDIEYTFEVRFIPIRHYINMENVIMLVFTDRSEAKKLDRQLIESMKFASIGEIAAGLAHEINNPLQSALLYLDDLIVVGEDDPAERKMILKKIESANLRIRDLVRSLLDLGRVESQTRDLVSPYYILVRSSELVELSCKKKGIEFFRHAGPNLPGIIVRWQEIEQVLINCVVNAINALSEMNPPREFPKIEIGIELINIKNKDWVVFSIEDNGPGMSEDTLDKAFLPLFTTRREMQGTGLGLSISKKIINDHDGEITIKSKLGVGSKIEIFLPAQMEKYD